jgi:acetyl esterase/lipase
MEGCLLRVKMKDINPQLRPLALLMKPFTKAANTRTYRMIMKLMHQVAGKQVKGLQYQQEWIPRKRAGEKLRICVLGPKEKAGDATGILWLHGGGYAIGMPEMAGMSIPRKLIEEFGCVVVAPDYLLSIEAPYPAALEDSYDALLWMKDHAKDLGIRKNQIMVGGESAGGGLAAALCIYARDKKEVAIAFQMPIYPMLDDRMITESATDNNAPVWNSNTNEKAWKLYLGDLYGGDVPPYAAAAREKDYRGLPPAFTFVGDLEPFRDETIAFVDNLRNAGVEVNFEIYKGCYHAFDLLKPNADVSRQATEKTLAAFRYAREHYYAEQSFDF